MTNNDEFWEGVSIHIQIGDILTSKKGLLFGTSDEKVMQACERVQYLGKGHWKVLGEKRRKVDVKVRQA